MTRRVDVWRASLLRPAGEVARLERVLDPEERLRAERFREERDRRRFIVAHATVRSLIAGYAGIDPRGVNFTLSSAGKPVVSNDRMAGKVHFSLSHSGEFALCAIADSDVGVDVELVAPRDDMERVAEHFFSPEEAHVMKNLWAGDRPEFFFRTWVRKEAYLKATGEGLGRNPASFIVQQPPARGVLVDWPDGRRQVDHSFGVYDLPKFDNYFAAIALAGPAPGKAMEYRELIS